MIDRENVIENLEQNISWIEEIECHQFPGWGNVTMAMMDAVELLKDRGRWVKLTGMAPPEYHGHKVCSLCDCMAPYNPLHVGREMLTPYCPGCGAKMEGEVG